VQVEEGLVVAVEVEESVAPPPPVVASVMGEEWVATEMPTSQARSEPQAGTGSGDDDVVMVPVDQGAPSPLPTRDHETVVPEGPETPAAAIAPTVEGAEDAPMSGSWSIPGIRVIDLDATELPSNDREVFEAVVERVFANPAVLEAEVPGATAPVAAAFDDGGPHPAWRSCRTPPCRSSQRWARVEMSGVPHSLPRRKRWRGFSESLQLVRSWP
jgi:hypothetical protein